MTVEYWQFDCITEKRNENCQILLRIVEHEGNKSVGENRQRVKELLGDHLFKFERKGEEWKISKITEN